MCNVIVKSKVENFIKNHKHINYCEVIIHKDGDVEYIRPSHLETLIRLSGVERAVLEDTMPILASPINWMVEYTGIVSAWTCGYIKPLETTAEQMKTLKLLIESKLIKDSLL